jgi:hypothetical protein
MLPLPEQPERQHGFDSDDAEFHKRLVDALMLAARASMPVSIRDGSVMNEPPPANAFRAPAHIDAMMRTRYAVTKEPMPHPG